MEFYDRWIKYFGLAVIFSAIIHPIEKTSLMSLVRSMQWKIVIIVLGLFLFITMAVTYAIYIL